MKTLNRSESSLFVQESQQALSILVGFSIVEAILPIAAHSHVLEAVVIAAVRARYAWQVLIVSAFAARVLEILVRRRQHLALPYLILLYELLQALVFLLNHRLVMRFHLCRHCPLFDLGFHVFVDQPLVWHHFWFLAVLKQRPDCVKLLHWNKVDCFSNIETVGKPAVIGLS